MPNRLWVALAFMACLAAAPPQPGRNGQEQRGQINSADAREPELGSSVAAAEEDPSPFDWRERSALASFRQKKPDDSCVVAYQGAWLSEPGIQGNWAVDFEAEDLASCDLGSPFTPSTPEAPDALALEWSFEEFLARPTYSLRDSRDALLLLASDDIWRTQRLRSSAPGFRASARLIQVDHRISAAGDPNALFLEVWLTRDGYHWKRYNRLSYARDSLAVQLPGEGFFGIRLVARKQLPHDTFMVGADCLFAPQPLVSCGTPRPQPGDAPQLWVEVDESMPLVEARRMERPWRGSSPWSCYSRVLLADGQPSPNESPLASLASLSWDIEQRDQLPWIRPLTPPFETAGSPHRYDWARPTTEGMAVQIVGVQWRTPEVPKPSGRYAARALSF